MRGRVFRALLVSLGATLALAPAAAATGLRANFAGGPQGFEDGISLEPAAWAPEGGNPGGHIFDASPSASLATPDAWAGDRSSAFGGTLSFDVRLDPSEAGTVSAQITCGSCPEDVHHTFAVPATSTWKRFRVRLVPGAGWNFDNQEPATRLEFIAALQDMLRIVLTVNGDVAQIDNVVLAASVRRRLTLNYSGARFAGKLSGEGACSERQQVVVYRKRGGADAQVGSDRTNADGKYAVREPDARPGSYYARAPASFAAGTGNCLVAKSPTVQVD